MRRALRAPTLRRTLIIGAVLVAAAASAAMLIAFSLAVSQRNAIDRDTNAFLTEQHIADQIVALTYRQQLEAFRFVDRHDEARMREFRDLGDEVYSQMRRYLFHELSAAARLHVERMKELHQGFEVVAQRVFDLAQRGQSDSARRRLADLDQRAESLDAAVEQFLTARREQRSALQLRHEEVSRRVGLGFATAGALMFVLLVLLAGYLRRRVLGPLDALAAAAGRLGAGDLDARVAPQRYAEFDEMAAGFNRMADSVQSARETMEAQNEEIRQTLDHLQQAQAELVQHEKLSAMGQMLAGLAHELNNPLAGVLGMAELIRAELAESPDADARAMATTLAEPLEREALRARSLVRNLLSFARRPSGVVEPVDLTAAVSTALGLCAHSFAQAGKTLRVELRPHLRVMADAQKLQHAIVNVVNNALDAVIAADGRGLTIVGAPTGRHMVRIDFDDDGTGFADPQSALLPFYTTKAAGKGTGLGLSLVEQFVNEFGGTVTVSNRSEGGARVSLLLRASEGIEVARDGAARGIALPATHREAAPSAAAGGDSDAAAPIRPRVLVVDDEPTLRLIQHRLLTNAGMEVVLAANGAEARDALVREPFDLVISDLRMPGEMDGRDLLAWLAQERPALAARSLLLTGDMGGVASVPLPVPMDRVVPKPFSSAEYVKRVRQALGAMQK
ncbi:MAG TPA: response regulator [Gemmatimonadaceae bacterium]|nr:response regulator [Gemmatimonadaceae bacterium]